MHPEELLKTFTYEELIKMVTEWEELKLNQISLQYHVRNTNTATYEIDINKTNLKASMVRYKLKKLKSAGIIS